MKILIKEDIFIFRCRQYSCPVLSYVATIGVLATIGGGGDDVTTTGTSLVALAAAAAHLL